MKTKYIVSQTFETLGHASESEHTTLESAEAASETLRCEIAEMVSGMETPDSKSKPTGFSHECDAWNRADEIAGVAYDEFGNRTPNSPTRYGIRAGRYIANLAVSIESVEDAD